MGKDDINLAHDSDLEEGEIQEFPSEFLNYTAQSSKPQIQSKINYKTNLNNCGTMYGKGTKAKTDYINFTIKSHIVLSPKKKQIQAKNFEAGEISDSNAENISISSKSRIHRRKKKHKKNKKSLHKSRNISKKTVKKLNFMPVESLEAIYQRKSEWQANDNTIVSAQSRIIPSSIKKNRENKENSTILAKPKKSSSRRKLKKHHRKKDKRRAKSELPPMRSKIRSQTKMNSSVIEINDSVFTIESDGEVEDGEVQETDMKILNITAKRDPTTRASKINKQLDSAEAEKLLFEVKFHNKDDFKSLYDRLLTALNSTFSKDEFEMKTDDTELIICAYTRVSATEAVDDSKLFLIDTVPRNKLNVANIPSYKRCNTNLLDEDTPDRKRLKAEAVNKCSRPKVQSSCFNCGESDHSLRECTRPRNQARIQRARKKTSIRADRYHVDTEQRFAHIRPGKISTKTRHAMGFSRGEMPFIFYRMRVLGYPPAWLEEAKVQGSGMALFNAEGNEVQGPHEEEGESDSFKYDVNKIFDFPGFNVHPGTKFYDDYQHHSVPPFQESQLKENFIKSLGENVIKGYKRKKLIDLPAAQDLESSVENGTNYVEHDMELDDGEIDKCLQPPLPFESNISEIPPPPPPPQTEPGIPNRSPSPTLEDLKEQQTQLLQQLQSNTPLNSSDIAVELDDSKSKTDTETTPQTPDKVERQLFNGPSIQGTPVLKFSEFEKLPVGDNFKVGVSDVINFENLPDSTGKYEQMKDLLKNVRVKMEKLQNSDD